MKIGRKTGYSRGPAPTPSSSPPEVLRRHGCHPTPFFGGVDGSRGQEEEGQQGLEEAAVAAPTVDGPEEL